jgi:hypothetical protein
VPVMIHTGDTYSAHAKVRYAHPLLVDDVAVDYPDVRFVACHLGNPWFQDCAEVLYKNDNVYADISGLTLGDFEYEFERYIMQRVRDMIVYMGEPGRQLMFGTDWPLAGMPSYVRFLDQIEVTPRTGSTSRGKRPPRRLPSIRTSWQRRTPCGSREGVTLSVPRTQPIQVGLSVEPLELEGITVEAVIESAERNLERRRRAYPGTVRVITREHLDRSAGFVSNAVQSYGAFIVDCVDRAGRPIPGEARQCVNLRGERSHRPLVCIDGRRALDGIRQLDSYGPESLHSVEVYGGGRMIQAYTHAYLRWQGAGRLPVGLIDC